MKTWRRRQEGGGAGDVAARCVCGSAEEPVCGAVSPSSGSNHICLGQTDRQTREHAGSQILSKQEGNIWKNGISAPWFAVFRADFMTKRGHSRENPCVINDLCLDTLCLLKGTGSMHRSQRSDDSRLDFAAPPPHLANSTFGLRQPITLPHQSGL